MKEVLRSETFSQALRAVVVAINTVFVVTAACALSNLPKRGEAFGSIAQGLGASAVFVVIVLVCFIVSSAGIGNGDGAVVSLSCLSLAAGFGAGCGFLG